MKRGLIIGVVLAAVALPRAAHAAFHNMKVVEVYAGTTSDPGTEYVVLQMWAAGQNLVSGHAITVFDASGTLVGTYTFAANVGNGANQAKILIGTAGVTTAFGVTPDLVMATASIAASGGKVCFDAIPADCVTWGNYTGPGAVGAPAAPGGLAPGAALRRDLGADGVLQATDDTDDSFADFDLFRPSPVDNGGAGGSAGVCVNGAVEGFELCDDNNASQTDACLNGCVPAYCGDGFVEGGDEACDGANLDGETCASFGYVSPAGLACNGSCSGFVTTGCTASCGNSVAEPGEPCDTGGNSATCDANCTAVACGDGTCNGAAGENAATCAADCPTTCGDGLVTGTESCDGASLAGQTCASFGYVNPAGLACNGTCNGFVTTGCTAVCGNSVAEPGEPCDTGGNSATCDANCTAVACGDGTCNGAAGETTVTCTADCGSSCGDGAINGGEVCDGANLARQDCEDHGFVDPAGLACSGTCGAFVTTGCAAVCGNSVAEPGEPCDTGGSSLTCDASCNPVVCGDAMISGAEVCDGANLGGQDCTDHAYVTAPGLACAGSCAAFVTAGCTATCGNVPEPGEPCDGGGVDTAACDEDCTPPSCGDGHCNLVAGETPVTCAGDCPAAPPDAGVEPDASTEVDAGGPDADVVDASGPDASSPAVAGDHGCCDTSASPGPGGLVLALLTLVTARRRRSRPRHAGPPPRDRRPARG